MKIAMVAGEASGDLLGARLIQALKQQNPSLQIEGIGGPAMLAAGCQNLFDIERLSVMGFIEPLFRLPDLIKLRRDLYRHFTENPPDVFIGIDAPDFNLGLELKLRKAGIPVVHYVSPSVWAWRQYRIHKIAKAVDLMVTLLPFEADFYEKHQVPVFYAGHPLAEQIEITIDKTQAKERLCLDPNKHYIALLPGSRKQELKYMAETYLKAAKIIAAEAPEVHFLTAHVNEQRYKQFFDAYKQFAPDLPITFFTRRSQDIMAAADVVIVTSGTATLETMLHKKPMIIAYKMGRMTYQLAKRLVKSKYAGLPNLLADEEIVPELIQSKATPGAIANHVLAFLNDPEKIKSIEDRFTAIHHKLQGGTLAVASQRILALSRNTKEEPKAHLHPQVSLHQKE